MFVRVKLKISNSTLLKGGSIYDICDAFDIVPTIYYKDSIEKSMAQRGLPCVCDTISLEQFNSETKKVFDSKNRAILL